MNYLTFDIEEWYIAGHKRQVPVELWPGMESRVEVNTMRILEILRNYSVKGHFFIMGWVAERHPHMVEPILKEGHGIGYHSWWHQDISKITDEVFEEDLAKGLDFFKDSFGLRLTTYRAPYFSMTNGSLSKYKILLRHGIEISSSVKSGIPFPHAQRIPPGEAPSSHEALSSPFKITLSTGSLLELPLNRFNLAGLKFPFSGSGYFRLLPISLIVHLIQSSDYTMSYFHPRDLDPAVPATPHNSPFRTVLNRLGSKNSTLKFNRLLNNIPFDAFPDSLDKMELEALPKIQIS